jgi:hypothetical protein
MAKPKSAPTVEPFAVKDTAVAIAPDECRYTIDLDELTVIALMRGICPEALSERMFHLLAWEREQYRVDARQRAALKESA